MTVRAMTGHFDLKRDAVGWTVFDRWTARPVVIAWAPQIGLTLADAEALVRELNGRGDPERRIILQ